MNIIERLKKFDLAIPKNLKVDKKKATVLKIALLGGVLLLLLSGPVYRRVAPRGNIPISYTHDDRPAELSISSDAKNTYEQELEQRLEEVLSLVEGVGQVRVLVSLERGRETVFAVDRNTSSSITQEQDAQGGTRYQSSQSGQDNTIIIADRTGIDRPLVVKEIEPVVSGVIIIAEGGDNIHVRDALIRSTSALLGISANRVNVMQMKNID